MYYDKTLSDEDDELEDELEDVDDRLRDFFAFFCFRTQSFLFFLSTSSSSFWTLPKILKSQHSEIFLML